MIGSLLLWKYHFATYHNLQLVGIESLKKLPFVVDNVFHHSLIVVISCLVTFSQFIGSQKKN